jgi:hypothetical protein
MEAYLFQVVGQITLKLLARVEESGPHGAHIAVHDSADFFMGQALDIMQGNNHSMSFRQFLKGGVQFLL